AGLLILGHFEDRIHGLLLGGVDETASINNDHIRVGRMRSKLMPAGCELAHHYLAIDKVLRAPQTDESDFHCFFRYGSGPAHAFPNTADGTPQRARIRKRKQFESQSDVKNGSARRHARLLLQFPARASGRRSRTGTAFRNLAPAGSRLSDYDSS